MKVFISWSGQQSQAVARALYEWIPRVIQAVKPWMSDVDIAKGARWTTDLNSGLKDSSVGIICLTAENRNAPWLHFEAGALSQKITEAYVCPYLFRLQPSEVTGPLTHFQAASAVEVDTKGLIQTINKAQGDGKMLQDAQVEEAFTVWWPRLAELLNRIPVSKPKPSKRSTQDMVEEILALVRRLSRSPTMEDLVSAFGADWSGPRSRFAEMLAHRGDLGLSARPPVSINSWKEIPKGATGLLSPEPIDPDSGDERDKDDSPDQDLALSPDR